MKQINLICFLLWGMALHPLDSYTQTFECDDRLFLALSPGILQPSSLFYIDADQTITDNNFSLLEDSYGQPFNCIGYNVQDQYIYGLNPYNYHLYQIDAFGSITDLGVPANLDTVNYEYYAGAINPQGNRLTVVGRDKSDGLDKVLYSIRFDLDDYPAGILSLNAAEGSAIEDIAYDPEYGDIYGYDGLHRRLVTLDLGSGGVVTYEASTLGAVNNIGSLFFDDQGVLYGYGSGGSEENTLFKFNKFERSIIESYAGPPGAYSDGCACPYRIKFYKKPSTHQVAPCSEFTLTYLTHNTAGSSYTQKTLLDSFPESFTITEIIRPPVYGEIESGVGTNKLHVSGMDVLLGMDSVVIRVAVGAEAVGTYTNQAILDGFPMALGYTILSDDVVLTPELEATEIEVLQEEGLLSVDTTFICEAATITLGGLDLELDYLWSTGATAATIEVTEPGDYWLEVSNDCITYRDTITVAQAPVPLVLDLGSDLIIDFGTDIALDFVTNASTEIWTLWEADADDALSCINCRNPLFSPTSSGNLSLSIEDAYGCVANDEIYVEVNSEFSIYAPNIFSPNEDGNNDFFYLRGKFDFDLLNFTVFNRWGSAVYHTSSGTINNTTFAWDGTFGGRNATKGIYLWIATIQLPDGTIKKMSGDVSLIR